MMKKAAKIALLVGLVCWTFVNSNQHFEPVLAQDGPSQRISALAEAVHLQNLRTSNVTLWVGGTLGELNGSEINASAGAVVDDWYFTDLFDESLEITTNSMNRPAAINVWASWCGPCQFEFPFLAELGRSGGLNYDLWFLNAGDTMSAAQRFVRNEVEGGANGLTLYFDPGDAYISSIGLQVFPTTLLIDTDGTILLAHSGIVTRTVMEFFNAVAESPYEGSFDRSSIDVGEQVASIEPVDAADATPIVYHQQVAGEITDEKWQDAYRFEGKAGDELTIEMTSTDVDFDAYLVLLGPDGERVAENDDGPNRPNSQINVTLPTDGTYIVVATRFLERDGFVEGGYNLTVSQDDGAASNQIIFDIPVSGRLTTDFTRASYLMDASAGQVLTFTLEHDNATEILHIEVRLGAGERVVPYSATENGLFVYEATIPQDGSYSVYVSRSSSSTAGPITFTLTVTGVNADGSPATNSVATSDAGSDDTTSDGTGSTDNAGQDAGEAGITELPQVEATLSYGDSVTGVINDDTPFHVYDFAGTQNETVIIRMTADERQTLDTHLTLLGPDGTTRSENDDANITTTDSEIIYTLTDDGTYQIVASRYLLEDGISRGGFTLTLGLSTGETSSGNDTPDTPPTNTNPPPGNASGFEIEYGTTVVGSIDSATLDQRYVFIGERGDVVTIIMRSTDGNLDSYLSLLDANGVEIAFNDEDVYGTGNDAAIRRFTLPADATYTILATRYGVFNGISSGSYELILDTDSTGS